MRNKLALLIGSARIELLEPYNKNDRGVGRSLADRFDRRVEARVVALAEDAE